MLLPITDSRFLRSSGFFPSWEDWPHALCLWVWWVDWQASLSDKQAGNLFSGSHCPFQLTVPFLQKTCFAASCHRRVLYKYIWPERRLWPRSHWKCNSSTNCIRFFLVFCVPVDGRSSEKWPSLAAFSATCAKGYLSPLWFLCHFGHTYFWSLRSAWSLILPFSFQYSAVILISFLLWIFTKTYTSIVCCFLSFFLFLE